MADVQIPEGIVPLRSSVVQGRERGGWGQIRKGKSDGFKPYKR